MKKKRMKLTVIFLAVTLLVVGVLSGCSKEEEFEEDSPSEEVEQQIDPYDLFKKHWKENGQFKWGADNHFELEAYLKACGFKNVATVSDGSTFDEIAVVGCINGWRLEIPLNSSNGNYSDIKLTGDKGKEAFCAQIGSKNINNLISNWDQEGYFVTVNGNGDKVHQGQLKILPYIVDKLMNSKYEGNTPFTDEDLPEDAEQRLTPPSY